MELTVEQIKEMMKADGFKIVNKTSLGMYAKEKGFKKKMVGISIYVKEKPEEES